MKLSEAIRLGAMLKPQTRGAFFYNGGTCASGAALDAVGRLNVDDPSSCKNNYIFRELFPIAAKLDRCPVCEWRNSASTIIERGIWHMNDIHEWTREQIADWVESIERAHDPVIETEQKVAMEQAVPIRSEAQKCIS